MYSLVVKMSYAILFFLTSGSVLSVCVGSSVGHPDCPWSPANNGSDVVSRVKCVRGKGGVYHLSLLPCYCLTRYGSSSTAVLGLCPYTCDEGSTLLHYVSLPPHVNVSVLSWAMCKNFSRSGQICGQCETGHALAAYSYTLNCVNCSTKADYRLNWLKYIGAAYGPQTLFFVVVVVSRVSLTSGLMVGYVTVSQVLATATELRFKAAEIPSNTSVHTLINVLSAVYSFWNLDFFRAFYTPFCITPQLPPLAVMSLDYAVALYPMVLIVVTYYVLTLCGRFKSTLGCWMALYRFVHRCYQACDIRNSLVDAFTTIIILSYVKILNTSFQILLPVHLLNENARVLGLAVYFSGNMKYFGAEHLPYAILAFIMLLIFNILPLVLLTLYSCHCFRKTLNKCWNGSYVHTVMDNFSRCYKTAPRDYRPFSVAYLYLRVINLALLLVTLSPVYFGLTSILYMCMAVLTGVLQPFKDQSHNVINATLFAVIAAIKIIEHTFEYSLGVYESSFLPSIYRGIEVFLLCIPPLYGVTILFLKLFPKTKLLLCIQGRIRKRMSEESFPYHARHTDEYAHLLSVDTY